MCSCKHVQGFAQQSVDLSGECGLKDMQSYSSPTIRNVLKKFSLWTTAILFVVLFQEGLAPQFSTVAAQSVATEQPEHRKTSTPYTGDLSIFDSADRDKKLQVQRVMDVLGIHTGTNVADIGAGSGWFTVRAAKRTGANGTVYAVDINPESIQYIDERIRKENISNVRTVLSKPDDPGLPENNIDSVLILKTYHEIATPVRLLENLRKSLRSGARVGVIDRNGNGEDHGIQKDLVVKEAAQAGYRLVDQYDFVKADREDYFLVFQVKSDRP